MHVEGSSAQWDIPGQPATQINTFCCWHHEEHQQRRKKTFAQKKPFPCKEHTMDYIHMFTITNPDVGNKWAEPSHPPAPSPPCPAHPGTAPAAHLCLKAPVWLLLSTGPHAGPGSAAAASALTWVRPCQQHQQRRLLLLPLLLLMQPRVRHRHHQL
jgi:hypothetical protein